MERMKTDVVVIGAGVIGLAVARALALQGREVLVLEANRSIGMEISSRNSEVIHAGLYYHPGSLKATTCVRGKVQLYEYCATKGVPHRRVGKLVVANGPEQAAELGDWFMDRLRAIDSPHVAEVRGKGLMIGVVVRDESGPARPFCEALMERGILAKETHEQVIRFAPPLVVKRETLEWALGEIAEVLVGSGAAVGG